MLTTSITATLYLEILYSPDNDRKKIRRLNKYIVKEKQKL